MQSANNIHHGLPRIQEQEAASDDDANEDSVTAGWRPARQWQQDHHALGKHADGPATAAGHRAGIAPQRHGQHIAGSTVIARAHHDGLALHTDEPSHSCE